jgi:hypothetical protein
MLRASMVALAALVALTAVGVAPALAASSHDGNIDIVVRKKPGGAIHVTTDDAGNFSFGHLAAGDYVLTISAAQFQQRKISIQGMELSVAASSAGQRAIPKIVSATQAVSGISLTVAADGTISGRLYGGGTTGAAACLDSNGKPTGMHEPCPAGQTTTVK